MKLQRKTKRGSRRRIQFALATLLAVLLASPVLAQAATTVSELPFEVLMKVGGQRSGSGFTGSESCVATWVIRFHEVPGTETYTVKFHDDETMFTLTGPASQFPGTYPSPPYAPEDAAWDAPPGYLEVAPAGGKEIIDAEANDEKPIAWQCIEDQKETEEAENPYPVTVTATTTTWVISGTTYQKEGGTCGCEMVTAAGIKLKLEGKAKNEEEVAMTAKSDEHGHWELTVPEGVYTVMPEESGWEPSERKVVVNANVGGVNFTHGDFTLSGKVLDTEGKPVAGASALVKDTEQGTGDLLTSEPTTNKEGEFKETLAPGKALVSVKPLNGEEFFPVESKECKVVASSCEVNLNQDRSVEFTACVLPNPNGEPLPANTPEKIPGAIATQNLEAVGCWTQQSDGNTYISTKPVRLDGLDLVPTSAGTQFELDKSAATVHVNGQANVQLKGIAIWPFVGGSTISFKGSSVAVTDLGLGEAYAGFSGPRIAGVPLAVGTGGALGSLVPPWSSTPGQTQLTLNPVVPVRANASSWNWEKGEFNAGKYVVPNFGPQFTITATNRLGLTLPQVCLTLGDQKLAPWEEELPEGKETIINGINGCYDFQKNEVGLSGILELPSEPGYPDRFSAAASFKGFQLQSVSAQVDGLNKPLNPYVYLQRIGLSASWKDSGPSPVPSAIELNGGLSFGPQLNESGPFGKLVAKYPVLDGAELASLDFSGTLALTEPTEFSLKGNILLLRRTPLQTTIAGGYVNYWTSGRFDWGGNLKLELPVVHAGLNANVNGFLDTDVHSGTFQLQGSGELSGLWGKPERERVLVNNNVIAACSDHEHGGFVYSFATGKTELFPAGVCEAGKYELPEPDPGKPPPPSGTASASAARAATAHGAGPYWFRLRRGLSATTLAVRGTRSAPFVVLAGPHGERVTTPASGALRDGQAFVAQDPATRTTDVVLLHPAGGAWSIRAAAHSSPIASLLESNPVRLAKITARTAEAGCAQRVIYTLHPAGGDQVALYAQNGSQRAFLGDARPGRHRVAFTPALGGGGQIVAVETHDGLPRGERTILTFKPTAYRRAATPRGIRLTHGALAWTAACGAHSYSVEVTHAGVTTTETTTTDKLALPGLAAPLAVTIQAINANGVALTSAHAQLSGAGSDRREHKG